MGNDFISLACPSCGGTLRVTEDIERFHCKHCGREHLMRRERGQVTLVPIVEQLGRIEGGVKKLASGADRHASELAIRRLKDDRQRLLHLFHEWDDEYRYHQGEAGSALFKAVAGLVFGALSALGAVILGSGKETLCCALPVGGVALFCGIVALISFLSITGHRDAAERARRKAGQLDKSLNEIESELGDHLDIVSRRRS